MLEQIALWFSYALVLYAAIGLLFAVAFVLVGVNRVDPAAPGSKPGFRVMILPGVAALWPLMLLRWAGGKQPPVERSAHRRGSAG
ncbi:hypothetical protein ABI59_18445 [Acidobacteria bacterium Mor1]|nr:hypothetical protein ABI59_18445 [Acidobacteria bacterium Mor1]